MKLGAHILTSGSTWDEALATVRMLDAAARVGELLEAGAHSFTPQIGRPADPETIGRLVGEVGPVVDGRTGA